MSTIVRNYHRETVHRSHSLNFSAQKFSISSLLLALVVLLSGLAVIYLTDINRHLAIAKEEAMNTQNQLELDWGKLLLEQSTWSTQARVHSIATEKLSMQAPTNEQIVLVSVR